VKYLIDSDVVVDYLDARQPATDILALLLPDGIAISLITYGEIYEGILFSNRSVYAEVAFLEFLRWARVLPLDEAIMRRFAGIRGSLRRKGMGINDPDILIAATALLNDLTLVTRNLKHFSRVPDLRVFSDWPS